MDLEQTLEQFDAVETNLRRLEKVWEEMQKLMIHASASGSSCSKLIQSPHGQAR
jgi:hypothetical protein